MIKPLYKAEAPFMQVKNGHGYQGVLMWDSDEDTVQCHICGKFFKTLGPHLVDAHKVSAKSYKLDHGLSLRTALCGKSVSKAHSVAGKKNYHKVGLKAINASKGRRRRPMPYRRPVKFYWQTMQAKNSRGLCDLQMRARYDVVKHMAGRQPTTSDIQKYDRKLAGVILQRYGINRWRKMMGERPLGPNEYRQIPDTALVARLRKMHMMLKYARKPRPSDFTAQGRDGHGIFYRRFGSWSNALRMAGVK